jgi:hypothetical protein
VDQPDITQKAQITVHSVHADSGQLLTNFPVNFPDSEAAVSPAQEFNNLQPLGC